MLFDEIIQSYYRNDPGRQISEHLQHFIILHRREKVCSLELKPIFEAGLRDSAMKTDFFGVGCVGGAEGVPQRRWVPTLGPLWATYLITGQVKGTSWVLRRARSLKSTDVGAHGSSKLEDLWTTPSASYIWFSCHARSETLEGSLAVKATFLVHTAGNSTLWSRPNFLYDY